MENQIIQPEAPEVDIAPDTPVNEPISEEVVESEATPEAVEPETPEEQATAEGAEAEETPEEVPEDVDVAPEVKPDSELDKALNRLEKLEKRLGYERRQRERDERNRQQAMQPREQNADVPKVDDFETYEEYQTAFIDYKIKDGISQYQGQQAQAAQQGNLDGFIEETTNAGIEKYSDFAEVARADHVPITQPMLHIMQDCENPEDVAYYLGKNIQDATAISRMSPIQASRAIAHIEMKIKSGLQASPHTGKPATPSKKVSKAPPPVKPTGSANVIQKDPNKMSQREYESWRAKGGGR